ncbi:MAG: hypothetical protein JOZ46_12430 [Candidatus Dormibacteraeota bacterium]|nr:hypothetical protein [Candidatus Dormibacteraeota bacterium]MBV9526607.1 hypothetical protein [Candidatus Dormibacteraeota bacterium]
MTVRSLKRGASVLAGAALAAALFSSPIAALAAGSSIPTTVLTNDVFPGLAGVTGAPAAPSTPVQVGVLLSDPAALAAQQAAYDAIYTPGSAQYHQFLTPDQVAAQFGIPTADYQTVASWVTRAGMQVAFASNTRSYLLLSGTVSQAESTFSVSIDDYSIGGTQFYANTSGPTVPAGVDVTGVIGLNNLLRAHTMQGNCAGSECIGLTTPQDMWSIYGQPTNISSSTANFGQGQQMAVLGEGAVSGTISDLRAFESEFALPQIPITIQSINDDFQDTSGNGEWDIDTQASTGMAPKAYGETLIFAKDLTDPSVLADFQAFEGDANVMQANASFGECEQDPTSPVTQGGVGTGLGGLAGSAGVMFTQGSETALQQATIEGKTLFSSTGDTGSSCPVVQATVIGAGNGILNQAYPETNYPASSRYVTAVGGTVLYSTPNTLTSPASNATRAQETSWTHTGGGNTFYIPEPTYQHGITYLDTQDCVSQPDGTPYASATPCRGIPDVAAQSGDVISNGYAVTMGGVKDSAGGGTSLSSPLWMGMWTRIQAATSAKVGGVYTAGFANPSLYAIGLNPTADVNDFFDIGGGPPTSPPTGNGFYTSQPRNSITDPSGWDYTSGLGAPNVTHLGQDVTGNNTFTPTNNVAAPAPQDCGQPGLVSCQTGGGTCSALSGLWTNPPHTVNDFGGNSAPQLSLLHGAFSTSADGTTLRTLLTVTNLNETVPAGETYEWYSIWTYNGTVYFSNAELSSVPGSMPTYHDGTVTVTGTTHQYNASTNTNDTGHFTLGANGVVEVDVPLANVGSPPLGATLTGPAGETDTLAGTPQSGGLLEKADSGGPTCDYVVGSIPTTSTPDAPVAIMLPAVGVAVALAVPALRRRRNRARV